MDNGEPRCIGFGALRVDDAIVTEVSTGATIDRVVRMRFLKQPSQVI
jgi:hypothetical protein